MQRDDVFLMVRDILPEKRINCYFMEIN